MENGTPVIKVFRERVQRTMSTVLLCLAILLTTPTTLPASPVSLEYKGLRLNANYISQTDKKKPIYLILHGTFAWHGMELPSTLQSLLEEENHGSLAFSLSLGYDNRSGFFDCNQKIIGKHDDAQAEIDLWVNYLLSQGYEDIAILGHSRGGAQIASYAVLNTQKIKQLILIAPMVWEKNTVHGRFNQSNSTELSKLIASSKNKPQDLSNIDILHCKNATISATAFLSYYENTPIKNTPQIIANSKIPTYIYLGSEDPLTKRFTSQQNLFEKNPHISTLFIDGSDHFFRDFYADEIVTDLLKQKLE